MVAAQLEVLTSRGLAECFAVRQRRHGGNGRSREEFTSVHEYLVEDRQELCARLDCECLELHSSKSQRFPYKSSKTATVPYDSTFGARTNVIPSEIILLYLAKSRRC